ncbi:hypothetical protein [Candidatus Entotheonella palauensis]|uniref:hypothetical protein n=1 Tax=Candidatus Entotheonella palauensis TaxID=93172 RepID=UPI001178C06C|nr:hypothetical protein [Candidatus Entotheonella palauensis]
MKTLYVNPKQQVTLICDHCGGSHTMAVPLHLRGNTPTKAQCVCGQSTHVVLEFRRAYRKNTFLQGLLQRHVTDVVGQAAQIRNLSQSGLQLTTRWWRNLHINDVLALTFILDNPQRSKIDKQIRVKYNSSCQGSLR